MLSPPERAHKIWPLHSTSCPSHNLTTWDDNGTFTFKHHETHNECWLSSTFWFSSYPQGINQRTTSLLETISKWSPTVLITSQLPDLCIRSRKLGSCRRDNIFYICIWSLFFIERAQSCLTKLGGRVVTRATLTIYCPESLQLWKSPCYSNVHWMGD